MDYILLGFTAKVILNNYPEKYLPKWLFGAIYQNNQKVKSYQNDASIGILPQSSVEKLSM